MESLASVQARKMAAKVDEVLSSKSVIHWSESAARSISVTCGNCKRKRTLVKFEGGPGLCPRCARGTPGSDETHASGSIIHWTERNPDDQSQVLITCYRCGEDKFVSHTTTWRDDWSGYCEQCRRETAGGRKRLGDEPLITGSIIHWSERDPQNHQRVSVICGLCGERRFTEPPHGKMVLAKWSGFCGKRNKHFQLLQGRSDNGQKNGGVEKREATNSQRHDAWLLDAVEGLIDLWKIEKQKIHSTREKRLTTLSEVNLAPYLGQHVGANKILKQHTRRRLTSCSVSLMFSGDGSWFQSFKETVVDHFEADTSAEKIVSLLKDRLNPARGAV
jgi:hypothetical protein